jgi:serine protease
VRPKNSSKFTLLAALKTSSTGTVSVTDKPLVSSVFMMTFPGNADLMGTRTPDITVQVALSIGRPAARGQIAYRIWFPGDADHAQAFSANKIVTVG